MPSSTHAPHTLLLALVVGAGCAPADLALADMPGKRATIALNNDGLISSPPMLQVDGTLTWEDDGAPCARAAPLTLEFSGTAWEAYDHGGLLDDGERQECLRQALWTNVIEVDAVAGQPTAVATISDGADAIEVEVEAPTARRALTGDVEGGVITLSWAPTTDVLPEETQLSLYAAGAAGGAFATVDATIDGHTITAALPEDAPAGAIHVVAELVEIELGVASCTGADACAARMQLFHRAEGDVTNE